MAKQKSEDGKRYDDCIDALLAGDIDGANGHVAGIIDPTFREFAEDACAAVRAAFQACLTGEREAIGQAQVLLGLVVVEGLQKRWTMQLREAAAFRSCATRADATARLQKFLPPLRTAMQGLLAGFPTEKPTPTAATTKPAKERNPEPETTEATGTDDAEPAPRKKRKKTTLANRKAIVQQQSEAIPTPPEPITGSDQESPTPPIDGETPPHLREEMPPHQTSVRSSALLGTALAPPPYEPTVLAALEFHYFTFIAEEALQKLVPAGSTLDAEIARADRQLRTLGRRVYHKQGQGWSVVPIDYKEPNQGFCDGN